MKAIDFKDIEIRGDLAYRTLLNYSRLESKWYRPEIIFKADQHGWPGDWEGRTILGVTLLAQSTKCAPAYLDEILARLKENLNERGYLGRILKDNLFDEQQLSGHSWLLRGLIEYYQWKKDESILAVIKNIVENLLLPTKGFYSKYPSKPEERVYEGEAAGNLVGTPIGNWYTSTDTGCAFIMLDGASHAYQLLRREDLAELIEEMIETFLKLELVSLSAQTHATLSASRGILRYYDVVKKPYLLEAVERIFSLYLREGMTENYANYNWFGRPDWTEPCAVVDSFIVAVDLWKNTCKSKYLEVAHNIFYNAMGYGQRPNGGFGCDICAGAQDEFLSPKQDVFEAYWCCSMRGGEGLARAVEYNCFIDENEIILPFYNNSTAQLTFNDGKVTLKQTTGYPANGDVKLEVVESDAAGEKTLKLFVPSWTGKESVRLYLNNTEVPVTFYEEGFVGIKTVLSAGTVVQLGFEIIIRIEGTINVNSITGYHSFRHGFLMLGMENSGEAVRLGKDIHFDRIGNASYKVLGSEFVLAPINDIIHNSEEAVKVSRKQVLFR